MEHEATQARLVAADTALQRLATLANEPWVRPEQVNDVRTYYEARRQRYHGVARGETNSRVALATTAAERLEHALINAELAALVQLRDHGMINDETLRQLQQELDLERVRLDVVLHARPGT